MRRLYIIHGWTYNLDKWQAILPSLSAQGIEVVFLKVPGLTEPSSAIWTINDYVEWLDKKLESDTQLIVLGHSNGGRIAMAYAEAHRDRLKQLILVDSAGVPHDQAVSRLKLLTLRYIAHVGKLVGWIPGLKSLFYKLIGAKDYYNAPPNMKLTMQNMLAADSCIDYASINTPTTIIWGRDDQVTPLADGKKLAKLLPNAKLIVIDNARHAPFASHSQAFADIIIPIVKA